jgi:hypothetical protein
VPDRGHQDRRVVEHGGQSGPELVRQAAPPPVG